MTIHLINRDTLPLPCTQVLLHILHTFDSLLQAYFYLKRRRLVKDMTNFTTSMLSDLCPPPETHTIWGSLHFLPLVLNVFLSGRILYGFNIVGSPCIDIYQMYVVVPMIQDDIP